MRKSKVALIRGATGCGKSTQLPKFLLHEAATAATGCSIVVTQPRRLAAMALADRVASELGETEVGGLCGYRIRGEARVSARTALTFVTTGLMLRQLESDPLLERVSHVIVDEVHERSVDTDLLLLVLRRAIANGTTAKIVLMSATVDASPFVSYFAAALAGGAVGVCDIPGRAFPVVERFLEDAIVDTGYRCAEPRWLRDSPLPGEAVQGEASRAAAEAREAAEAAVAAQAMAKNGTGSAIVAANLAERAAKLANTASAVDAARAVGGVATEWLRGLGARAVADRIGDGPGRTLRSLDLSVVNEELVEALVVRHHAREKGAGAVLVFVPGVAEVEQVAERLQRSVSGGSRLHVVRLHSQLTPAEQRAAFAPAPRAQQTKVVVATDIAETSVTIDDITLVIDGGLHRAPSVDARSGIVHLRTGRISLAAATQRAGRAGRVQAGTCYHLYCAVEATQGMAATPTAEIRRVPLEATVLRLNSLLSCGGGGAGGAAKGDGGAAGGGGAVGGGGAEPVHSASVLASTFEPPEKRSVEQAVASLVVLGALRTGADGCGETLTPLGRRLARLPTEPRLGKALLCAHALGCLEPAAVMIAAHEAAHDAFGRRSVESGAAKRALDKTSCHLALLRAHSEWRAARTADTREAIARDRGMSGAVLRELTRASAQLVGSVTDVFERGGDKGGGGVSGATSGGKGGGKGGGNGQRSEAEGREPASDAAMAAACLLAGAALMTRVRGGGRKPLELRWRHGKSSLALRPHPATVLGGGSHATLPEGHLCASLGAMRSGSGLVALDVTLVTPLAVLLFGEAAADRALAAAERGSALTKGSAATTASDATSTPPPPIADITDSAPADSPTDLSGEAELGAVTVDVAGEGVEMATADLRAIGLIRRRLDDAIGGGCGCDHALRQLLGQLLKPMDVPWAGLPEGWMCEADAAEAPLYRSEVDPTFTCRTKPTRTAARVAAGIAAGKGSLERANAEHAAKQAERAKMAAREKEEAAVAAASRREATRAEEEARAQANAAAEAAQREADAEEQKRVTLARAAAAEATEASARRRSGVAGSVECGLIRLLAELDISKYADAFASAGFGDSELMEIAECIDAEREEGGGSEGSDNLERMMAAVGLRGGSAVKFRKRLLEPPGKGGGRGGGAARGGRGGSGGHGQGGDGDDGTAKGAASRAKPKGGGAASGSGGRGTRGKDAKERGGRGGAGGGAGGGRASPGGGR